MQRNNTARTLPSVPEENVQANDEQRSVSEKPTAKLLRLPRRTRDEREFLPAALEIVDTPPSPVGRAIGFTIILVAMPAESFRRARARSCSRPIPASSPPSTSRMGIM